MSPETQKAIEIMVTAVSSGALAALGNSRAARRAVRRLRARVAALEQAQKQLSERASASDAQHARHRGAIAYLTGAMQLVGTQLGQRFGMRPRPATVTQKAP
jgi:hypothetical protein